MNGLFLRSSLLRRLLTCALRVGRVTFSMRSGYGRNALVQGLYGQGKLQGVSVSGLMGAGVFVASIVIYKGKYRRAIRYTYARSAMILSGEVTSNSSFAGVAILEGAGLIGCLQTFREVKRSL